MPLKMTATHINSVKQEFQYPTELQLFDDNIQLINNDKCRLIGQLCIII